MNGDYASVLNDHEAVFVWTVKPDLIVTHAAGKALAKLELTPEQLINKRLLDIEFMAQQEQRHNRALAGEPQLYEVEFRGRWYHVCLEPVDGGVQGLAVDVTHRVRNEQQVKLLSRKTGEDGIRVLTRVLELASEETVSHMRRVGAYSKVLALRMGWSEETADQLRLAAAVHDVGKIGVPDGILHRPGKLSVAEFEVVKIHAADGGDMLAKESDSLLYQLAAAIARHHHERWDGSGYPDGLAGTDIPESARIAAVADVFDALVTPRHYRVRRFTFDEVLGMMSEGQGKHFCPMTVDALFASLPGLIVIRDAEQDHPAE